MTLPTLRIILAVLCLSHQSQSLPSHSAKSLDDDADYAKRNLDQFCTYNSDCSVSDSQCDEGMCFCKRGLAKDLMYDACSPDTITARVEFTMKNQQWKEELLDETSADYQNMRDYTQSLMMNTEYPYLKEIFQLKFVNSEDGTVKTIASVKVSNPQTDDGRGNEHLKEIFKLMIGNAEDGEMKTIAELKVTNPLAKDSEIKLRRKRFFDDFLSQLITAIEEAGGDTVGSVTAEVEGNINSPCTEDDDCDVTNTRCENNYCKCKPKYTFDQDDLDKCYRIYPTTTGIVPSTTTTTTTSTEATSTATGTGSDSFLL